MKSYISAAILAYAATNVAAHATFQQLWVDGVDQGTTCARIPLTNSPVTDVTSTDLTCNAGTSAVSSNCAVTAGSTVTVEMHQQPNDRSCTNEAIGGAHYGPVLVYLSAVSDATAAVGSDGSWFKIFEDTWSSAGASGSDDNWGTKDLNNCCGKMDVSIPADLAPGDYLLRAEAIALHSAGSSGGAQFYVTCYQLTVSGSGTATVSDTVTFPGAYAAADPGILINIYQAMTSYEAPGPAVYAGGSTQSAGATCAASATGAAATTLASATSTTAAAATTSAAVTTSAVVTSAATSAQVTSTAQATTSAAATSQVQAASSSSSVVSSSTAAAPTTVAVSTTAATSAATSASSVTSAASSAKASSTGKGTTCKRRRAARANRRH